MSYLYFRVIYISSDNFPFYFFKPELASDSDRNRHTVQEDRVLPADDGYRSDDDRKRGLGESRCLELAPLSGRFLAPAVEITEARDDVRDDANATDSLEEAQAERDAKGSGKRTDQLFPLLFPFASNEDIPVTIDPIRTDEMMT